MKICLSYFHKFSIDRGFMLMNLETLVKLNQLICYLFYDFYINKNDFLIFNDIF